MLWIYAILICSLSTNVNCVLTYTSSGHSGSPCGGNHCLAPPAAACISNRCVCQPPTSKGIGAFLCSRPENTFCALYNDPTLLTFSGHRTAAPLHWMFLAAHVKTLFFLPITGEKLNGECQAKFYPFGKKLHGKTYVGGFVIEFRITHNGQRYNVNYRVTGSAEGGVYKYTFEGNHGNYSGPPYHIPYPLFIQGAGGNINGHLNRVDNVFRIQATFCGIHASLRPLDIIKRFTQVSGLYLLVESRAESTYLDLDQTLCSAPNIQEDSLENVRLSLSNLTQVNLTQEVAALYKVLTQKDIPQDFPGASSKLTTIIDLAKSCATVNYVTGLHYCIFLLDVPLLVNCLDPSDTGDVILNMFADCLTSFCLPDGLTTLCPSVKSTITESGCGRHILEKEITIFGHVCP